MAKLPKRCGTTELARRPTFTVGTVIRPPRRRVAAERFSLAAVVCLCGFGAAVAVAAPRGGQPRGPQPVVRHVLCWYANRPVYVRDAAGCPYAQGLSAFRRAYRRWGIGTGPLPGVIAPLALLPVLHRQHWALRTYMACLDGVLARYLRFRCVAAILARYHPDCERFLDARAMPEALSQQAALCQRYAAVDSRGIAGDWTADRFCREISTAFPKIGASLISIRSFYWPKVFMAHRAFYFAVVRAFPYWIRTAQRATGWQHYDFYAGLEQLYVGAILKERKAFFVRLANQRYGTWHFLIVIQVAGGKRSLAAIRALARSAVAANGLIPNANVAQADRALLALGSPTQIASGFGTKGYISAALTGEPIPAIAPNKFIPAKCPKSERPGFLFIYQSTPRARYYGHNLAPDSLVFRIAENYIVPPIIKHVLRKARPGPGLRLPTAKWLRDNMWQPLILDNIAGTPIPRVIIKLPWPGPVVGVY